MSEPIVPVRTYVIVFAALILLAALTTAIASLDLGVFNTVTALGIAALKMALVALFFMHIWYKPGLTRIVILAGFFWLALLVTMVLVDIFTRGWTNQPTGWLSGRL